MKRPKFTLGNVSFRKALEMVLDYAESRGINASGIHGWEQTEKGWRPAIRLTDPNNPSQFELRGAGEGKAKMYFGNATGLGFSGLVSPLVDGDWYEYTISSETKFYLKVEFEPIYTTRFVGDNDGNSTTVYVVDSDGDEAEVTIYQQTGGGVPEDQKPIIDAENGDILKNGIYHFLIGSASLNEDNSVSVRNEIFGPLGIGFCPPNGFRIWEIAGRYVA